LVAHHPATNLEDHTRTHISRKFHLNQWGKYSAALICVLKPRKYGKDVKTVSPPLVIEESDLNLNLVQILIQMNPVHTGTPKTLCCIKQFISHLHHPPLGPYIFLNTLLSCIYNVYSSIIERDHVSRPLTHIQTICFCPLEISN